MHDAAQNKKKVQLKHFYEKLAFFKILVVMIIDFGACIIFSRSVSPSEVQEEGAGENGKLPRNNGEEEFKLQLAGAAIAEEEGMSLLLNNPAN